MSIDEHVTIGDLDIDVDEEMDDEHPFEIGTRADGVVLAPERTIQLPETISVEAAHKLADQIHYAADHAAQYKREREREQEVDE